MTHRFVGGALVILTLAIALAWRTGVGRPEIRAPGASPGEQAPGEGGAPGGPAGEAVALAKATVPAETRGDAPVERLPPPPARDIFRYAEAPPPSPPRAPVEIKPAPAAAEAAQAPPPAVRLVGLVRRPEGLRAAVATPAGVVIVGPGDVVLGHTVLSLDEDRGLRLRTPDGTERILVPGRP